MSEDIVLTFGLAFIIFLLSLMFLKGFFHQNYKRKFPIIDIDQYLFPGKTNLIRESDKLAFWVCLSMSSLTLVNGFLLLIFPLLMNICAIFAAVGLLGSWLIKYIFLYIYKNSSDENIPRFWPLYK